MISHEQLGRRVIELRRTPAGSTVTTVTPVTAETALTAATTSLDAGRDDQARLVSGSEPEVLDFLVRLAGVEPATLGLEVRCSVQLSYRRSRHSRYTSLLRPGRSVVRA